MYILSYFLLHVQERGAAIKCIYSMCRYSVSTTINALLPANVHVQFICNMIRVVVAYHEKNTCCCTCVRVLPGQGFIQRGGGTLGFPDISIEVLGCDSRTELVADLLLSFSMGNIAT